MYKELLDKIERLEKEIQILSKKINCNSLEEQKFGIGAIRLSLYRANINQFANDKIINSLYYKDENDTLNGIITYTVTDASAGDFNVYVESIPSGNRVEFEDIIILYEYTNVDLNSNTVLVTKEYHVLSKESNTITKDELFNCIKTDVANAILDVNYKPYISIIVR